MSTAQMNPSDNSGTDHLQAAAIEWQRKSREVNNLAAERLGATLPWPSLAPRCASGRY